MKWTKVALVLVVCVSLLTWFFWPHLHQRSIRSRLVHAMHESGAMPGLVNIGFMSLAVHELDPPSYVVPVLWDLSTDRSDEAAADCAAYALMLIAQGHWSASFSREDWIDGLDSFVAGVERRGGLNELEQNMLVFLKEKMELRRTGEGAG